MCQKINKYMQRARSWGVAGYIRSCTQMACFCAVKWKGEIFWATGKSRHLSGGWVHLHAGRRETEKEHRAHTNRYQYCLSVIARGKQELWPTCTNCLLPPPTSTSEVAVAIHPATRRAWGKIVRGWPEALSGMDISSLFIYQRTPLLRAVKY